MNSVLRTTVLIWNVLLLFCSLALCHSARADALGTIDANAKIHVTVADEPQLTSDYAVDGDGNITMLYINQVHVQGLTPAQAAAAIRGITASGGKLASGLSQFYVSPQVVVTLTDPGGIVVTVTGLVSAPRHYIVRSGSHLEDVLQQAVPAMNADLSKVEITHGDTKTKETVDYRHYVESKADADNPTLHDGDIITLRGRDPLPIFVTVEGQVGKPGRFQVPAATSAYNALQSAGGPTLAANLSGIAIKHTGSADTTPFQFALAGQNPSDSTLNPVLQDGDTIVVPAAPTNATYTLTGPGIRNPAEYALPNGVPITLAAAIGRAGGLSDRAKVGEIQIFRTDPKTQIAKVIALNATDPNIQGSYFVQPGDNITIKQGGQGTKFDPLQIFGSALGIFGIFHH